ncbi:MAG: O-antigen polymerase [Caulobacter sp.]|nr:O-antigen polymerase [Caulobacter sp.]
MKLPSVSDLTASVSAGAGDRWAGFVALFAMAWIAPLAYLAPLGFAPMVGLTGLLAIPLFWGPGRRWPLPLWPVAVLVLLFGWAAISRLWSPYADTHGFAERTAFKIALQAAAAIAMIGAFSMLSREAARKAAAVLVAALVLLALILLADTLAGVRIYRGLKAMIGEPITYEFARRNIAQGCYVMALLFWPAAYAAGRMGWRVAIFPLGLMAAAIVLGERVLLADAPFVAFVAATGAWLAVRWLGPLAARLLIVFGIALFCLAPLVVQEGVRSGAIGVLHRQVPASWDARLDIWAFVSGLVAEHPLRGWGLDASRSFGTAIPLHPHNAAIQIWLELGALGAALAGALIGWIGSALTATSRINPSLAAAGAGSVTTYLVIGSLSFGVWQEWWLALGGLAAGCVVLVGRGWPGDENFATRSAFG